MPGEVCGKLMMEKVPGVLHEKLMLLLSCLGKCVKKLMLEKVLGELRRKLMLEKCLWSCVENLGN